MAQRGSSKALSEEHENWVARLYGGQRSKSSGAAETDAGDVRAQHTLIECKLTGHPGKPPKRLPVFIQQLGKIAHEAWSEGRDPALALRYYQPTSVMCGPDGWVDVIVMRARDAAAREEWYRDDT